MPRFAANLTMMYPDLPFLDRFEAAAKDGFRAVEYLFPYAYPPAELAARLQGHGLQQVLFNMPPGGLTKDEMVSGWDRGLRGTACVPGREAEFRAGLTLALEYAQALGCPRIHTVVGVRPDGLSAPQADKTLIANLTWAAHQAAGQGLELMIEPINTRSIPGFHLQRQDHAHAIVQAVGANNLKVQMDLFHCQIVEGDLSTKISQYLPTGRVGHFQLADVPARHEPGSGELNWDHLFALIDRIGTETGWDGWVGCEYMPADTRSGGTSRGLAWMQKYR